MARGRAGERERGREGTWCEAGVAGVVVVRVACGWCGGVSDGRRLCGGAWEGVTVASSSQEARAAKVRSRRATPVEGDAAVVAAATLAREAL